MTTSGPPSQPLAPPRPPRYFVRVTLTSIMGVVAIACVVAAALPDSPVAAISAAFSAAFIIIRVQSVAALHCALRRPMSLRDRIEAIVESVGMVLIMAIAAVIGFAVTGGMLLLFSPILDAGGPECISFARYVATGAAAMSFWMLVRAWWPRNR